MRELVLSILAIGMLLAFLAVLLVEVPRLDLGLVIVITCGFAIWDLFTTHRSR